MRHFLKVIVFSALAFWTALPIRIVQALDYPYSTAEPQKTGWPLTEAEGKYVLKPEHERRPGSADRQRYWRKAESLESGQH